MTRLLQDLRYSIRTFGRAPGFTAIAIAVLALAIGANTAVFSIINGLLFHPLSGRADELVGIYSHDRTQPGSYRPFSYPNYSDIRERADVFDALLAQTFTTVALPAGDTMRRAFAAVVTANYFDTIGVSLATGRPFTAAEERPGAAVPVAITGYAAWKAAGLSPAFVGSTMRINAQDFTIVGVAPEGFTGTMSIAAPEMWLPLGMFDAVVKDPYRTNGRGLTDRGNHALIVSGRLKPGVEARVADERLAALSDDLARAYPGDNHDQLLTTYPLSRMTTSTSPSHDDELMPIVALFMGLSAVVLLIACLNIANMLLARGAARRREIAVRLAIGASRGRVVRQLLTEGLLLGIAGAAAGLLLAYWATHAFTASLASALPLAVTLDPAPDRNVLAASAIFAIASTVLFGLGPALRLSRGDLVGDLKEDGTASGGAVRWFSVRNGLVVGQIALSLALLTAAGLFSRATINAGATDPGFSYDGALLVGIDSQFADFDEARGRLLHRDVLERIRALPGVLAAGSATTVPFGEFHESRSIEAVGSQQIGGREPTYRVISSGYFTALGLELVRGREFTVEEEQSATAPAVAIIDEILARKLFPGRDPIGESIRLGARESVPGEVRPTMQIVGVAPPIREEVTDRELQPHVYVPSGRHYRTTLNVHVKLAPGADPHAALRALRATVAGIDPRIPVVTLTTMREFHDRGLALWMLNAGGTMFAVLGLLALALAVVGVYGVKSYVVSSRTREIGIRMALGADRGAVLWLVLRQGLALTAVGLALGLPLALSMSFVLNSVMWGFTRFDAPVLLGAPLVLALSALVASYVPARRATRIAPMRALRS